MRLRAPLLALAASLGLGLGLSTALPATAQYSLRTVASALVV